MRFYDELNSGYRPFSKCLVSALAKSRAASWLVRTMAGDSRNLLRLLLDWSHLDFIQMASIKPSLKYVYNIVQAYKKYVSNLNLKV